MDRPTILQICADIQTHHAEPYGEPLRALARFAEDRDAIAWAAEHPDVPAMVEIATHQLAQRGYAVPASVVADALRNALMLITMGHAAQDREAA